LRVNDDVIDDAGDYVVVSNDANDDVSMMQMMM